MKTVRTGSRGSAGAYALVVCSIAGFGVVAMAGVGSAFERSVQGNAHSGGAVYVADGPSGISVGAQAGLAGAGRNATRVFDDDAVRSLRRAAAKAFNDGKKRVTVDVRRAGVVESVEVDAIPNYRTYNGERPYAPKGYADQATQLRTLLDEAWDESIARGHLSAPSGRQMLEFTGTDTDQRAASRIIYSPTGIASVYMHGSPKALSRHAFVLEPTHKHSAVSRQVFTEKVKLATGETKVDDYGSSSIDVADVAARVNESALPDGTPILFRACSAGGCPMRQKSVAQQLATLTRRPVVAASDIHYRPVGKLDGKEIIRAHVKGDTGRGQWRLFLPETWHDDLPTSGTLDVASDLRGTHELYLLPDSAFERVELNVPLADISGRQNRGAIVQAAHKLQPGGTLRLSWNPDEVRRLQAGVRENVKGKWITKGYAQEILDVRPPKVDPNFTLKELSRAGYSVNNRTTQAGEVVATVIAPSR